MLRVFLHSVFAQDPTVVRFAHSAATSSPKGKMAVRFQQLVRNKIGDQKVVVEVYPNAILFDDDQLVDAVFNNRVELIATPVSNLRDFSPRMQLFDLPFLFVTEAAALRFLQGEYGDRLLRLVDPHGGLGLGYLNNGMKQLSSTTKVVVPSDAKNLKFLISSDSKVPDMQFRRIDARPVPGNLNKVVSLLESKIIDGQENTWTNIQTRGIHKHQPFILESNHVFLADMVVASKKGWNVIPQDLKAELEDLLKKAIQYGNDLSFKESKDKKILINASDQTLITQMTVNQRETWVRAMEGVWDQFESEIGSELINNAASAR